MIEIISNSYTDKWKIVGWKFEWKFYHLFSGQRIKMLVGNCTRVIRFHYNGKWITLSNRSYEGYLYDGGKQFDHTDRFETVTLDSLKAVVLDGTKNDRVGGESILLYWLNKDKRLGIQTEKDLLMWWEVGRVDRSGLSHLYVVLGSPRGGNVRLGKCLITFFLIKFSCFIFSMLFYHNIFCVIFVD